MIGDPGEVLDLYPGRAYMETTGYYWGWSGGTPDPDAEPDFDGSQAYVEASRWLRLAIEEWRPLLNTDSGALTGVLLSSELPENQVMGVTYDVLDKNTGALVMRVGRPWFSGEFEPIPDPDGSTGPDDLIYYFKLIKTEARAAPDPTSPSYGQGFDLAWEYMFRNYYYLLRQDIDPTTLEVEIRTNDGLPNNDYEDNDPETGRRWINVFGLDTRDENGNEVEGGDGRIDLDPALLDPHLGLLQFPIATPFDASYLTGIPAPPGNGGTPAPDIYLKSLTTSQELSNHYFNIVVRYPENP